MSKEDCDVLVNLLIIGDYGVGKTCLLSRYIDNTFPNGRTSTLDTDFKIKRLHDNGRRIRVHLWDTVGQEQYQTLSSRVYRGANGVFLVYDITKSSSFVNLNNWVRAIRKHARPDVKLALIGNKSDLEEYRNISQEQGEAFSEAYQAPFYETSAKFNTNVKAAFEETLQKILQAQPGQKNSTNNSVVLQTEQSVETMNNCCCCGGFKKHY